MSDIVSELRDLKGDYRLDVCVRAADEIERLRQALIDVQRPLARLAREADAEGSRLNSAGGSIAYSFAYLQEIAREAYPAPKL